MRPTSTSAGTSRWMTTGDGRFRAASSWSRYCRLLHGARIAVEHEAMRGNPADRCATAEHAVDQVVGNESTGGDDGLGFAGRAEFRRRSRRATCRRSRWREFCFSQSMMSRPCVPLPQPGGPKRRIIKDDCMVCAFRTVPEIDDNKVCQLETETRLATEDCERRSWRAASAGAKCRSRC